MRSSSSNTTRRRFLSRLGAGAAALSIGATARAAAKLPNFVFILSDDQGWTGLSAMMDDRMPVASRSDYYRTPNLERLANEGMRFASAYAPHPNCSPSRCSILTGKSPAMLHMTDIIHRNTGGLYEGNRMIPPQHINAIPADEITFPEILKRMKASYATAHFGKWHLGGGGPGEHGFDEHDGETGNGGPGNFGDPNPKDIFGISERACAFLEKQKEADRPFYMQLSHYATHAANRALKSTTAEYEALPKGERHNVPIYAAMTENLDDGVGIVMEKLDELGLADNTYVVYLADNGGFTSPSITTNDPLSHGKASVWEGGIRVPMIARGPGINAGSCCRQRVVGYDLFPTFLELAGSREPLPKGVEGGSLKALFESGGRAGVKRPREELVFHFPHYQHGKGTKPQTAILLGDYKLMKFWETGETQLFNLTKDIGETTDLSAKMPEKAKELEARMAKYLKDIKAQMATPNPDFDPATDPARNKGLNADGQPKKTEAPAGKAGRFTYKQGASISGKAAPNVVGQPLRIEAKISDPTDGIILTHGGALEGYALFVKDGKLAFAVRRRQKGTTVTAPKPLPKGASTVAATLAADGAMTVEVNGAVVAKGKAAGPLTAHPKHGLKVGHGEEKPVGDYKIPFTFKGKIESVEVVVEK